MRDTDPATLKFGALADARGGIIVVTESGFDKVPEPRRSDVMRSNDGGWAEQVQNIRRYVEH